MEIVFVLGAIVFFAAATICGVYLTRLQSKVNSIYHDVQALYNDMLQRRNMKASGISKGGL